MQGDAGRARGNPQGKGGLCAGRFRPATALCFRRHAWRRQKSVVVSWAVSAPLEGVRRNGGCRWRRLHTRVKLPRWPEQLQSHQRKDQPSCQRWISHPAKPPLSTCPISLQSKRLWHSVIGPSPSDSYWPPPIADRSYVFDEIQTGYKEFTPNRSPSICGWPHHRCPAAAHALAPPLLMPSCHPATTTPCTPPSRAFTAPAPCARTSRPRTSPPLRGPPRPSAPHPLPKSFTSPALASCPCAATAGAAAAALAERNLRAQAHV
jgi:hypothetical protein